MVHVPLLPSTSSLREKAIAEAGDVYERLGAAIDGLHGLKILNPPPSFLPYLVYEYGLGELTPYVPNLYELIAEGIDWQRIRGTHSSVAKGLSWLGYGAVIEEAPTRRRYWNTWQIELDRLRDDEVDLPRIEGICSLSAPRRSDFWRGYWGYDIRPLEYGWSRWGHCFYSDDSGVRLTPGGAKWSFGRTVYLAHDMEQAELEVLGVWLEPVVTEDLAWGDFTWGDFAWVDDADIARSSTMLAGVGDGTAWAVFKDAEGDVIGYRRCRVRRGVEPDPAGPYRVGASTFSPRAASPTMLFVEALTGFGEGYGRVAASVGFILAAEPLATHKPGVAWLPAGGLAPDLPIVALHDHTIEFGRTVRERVAAILRF